MGGGERGRGDGAVGVEQEDEGWRRILPATKIAFGEKMIKSPYSAHVCFGRFWRKRMSRGEDEAKEEEEEEEEEEDGARQDEA